MLDTQTSRLNVQIIGCGHSGSTLLDMLLGGHRRIASLGEVYFLHFYARHRREADLCTCGSHVLDCPFWSKVDAELGRRLSLPAGSGALATLELADPRWISRQDGRGQFRKRAPGEPAPFRNLLNQLSLLQPSRWLRRAVAGVSAETAKSVRIAENLNLLYDAVADAHDKAIVVDSTKNPGTFKAVYHAARQPMKFILVTRDGRGVCNSRVHREGVTMSQAISFWMAENFKRWAAQVSIPPGRTLRVRYEALCADPRAELARVCDFLGVAFEEPMLDFRTGRHNLGGNPMRRRTSETAIRLDERWRTDLTPLQLAEFARRGRWLNWVLGYGP